MSTVVAYTRGAVVHIGMQCSVVFWVTLVDRKGNALLPWQMYAKWQVLRARLQMAYLHLRARRQAAYLHLRARLQVAYLHPQPCLPLLPLLQRPIRKINRFCQVVHHVDRANAHIPAVYIPMFPVTS